MEREDRNGERKRGSEEYWRNLSLLLLPVVKTGGERLIVTADLS